MSEHNAEKDALAALPDGEWRSMQERQMARAIEREREMGIQ